MSRFSPNNLYLLNGLLSCHICREPLVGRVASNGYRIYLCENHVDSAAACNHEHTTMIKASVVEMQLLDATRQMLADPWHIADIWHGLQSRQHDQEAAGPAPLQISLAEFTQRTQLALAARDFQTRRDLVDFFVQDIVVSDDALTIQYIAPMQEYGRLARVADDFFALVRFKATELCWSVSPQRFSTLLQSRLSDASHIFKQWFPLLYLGWLGFAGLLITAGFIQTGLIFDSLLIVFLLYLKGYMPDGEEARLAWVSALPPILRLLSYSVPVPDVSLVVQLALVGVPALAATLIMMHTLQQPLVSYGISFRNVPAQIAIVPLGLAIGLLEWLLFEPQMTHFYADLVGVEKMAFIALFITAITEELVFRGLLQQGALAVYGHTDYWGTGIIFANIAYASMHIGYGPIAIIFTFIIGILYSILSHRTGSVFGVLWAHGLSSIVLLALLS